MVYGEGCGYLTDALESYGPLPVLDRFPCVGRPQDVVDIAVRRRDGSEFLYDEVERERRVEVARDHEKRVVRLVVLPVEGLKPLDRHILYVRSGSDRRVRVVVPQVARREYALE